MGIGLSARFWGVAHLSPQAGGGGGEVGEGGEAGGAAVQGCARSADLHEGAGPTGPAGEGQEGRAGGGGFGCSEGGQRLPRRAAGLPEGQGRGPGQGTGPAGLSEVGAVWSGGGGSVVSGCTG